MWDFFTSYMAAGAAFVATITFYIFRKFVYDDESLKEPSLAVERLMEEFFPGTQSFFEFYSNLISKAQGWIKAAGEFLNGVNSQQNSSTGSAIWLYETLLRLAIVYPIFFAWSQWAISDAIIGYGMGNIVLPANLLSIEKLISLFSFMVFLFVIAVWKDTQSRFGPMVDGLVFLCSILLCVPLLSIFGSVQMWLMSCAFSVVSVMTLHRSLKVSRFGKFFSTLFLQLS